jgi:NitT/TauT family transport system ATP-binding protein
MPLDTVAAGAAIAIRGASMRYATGVQALNAIDFDVAPGEFVSIVGPSGCGKSTLLRMVARLIAPTGGECTRFGTGPAAFVFQEPALLPWRNVQSNAELLMELEHRPEPERRARAAEALKVVGLAGFETAFPHNLSGGMRMRLSLARAIALEPELLLLDEPLAAVDELTREVLQEELSQMWQSARFTAMLVTHNVHEAVYLSSRVLVMSPRPGRVLEVVDVPFAFPRDPELRAMPGFARLAGHISSVLRKWQHG